MLSKANWTGLWEHKVQFKTKQSFWMRGKTPSNHPKKKNSPLVLSEHSGYKIKIHMSSIWRDIFLQTLNEV